MAPDPSPLPAERVLSERFQIERLLGRGGFGIAYLAHDLARGDLVVVKELAPYGNRRQPDGSLDLGSSGPSLRNRFLGEVEVLRRFHHPGVPSLRSAFSENGTAYHVTAYLPGSRTLDDRLRREGPLSEEDAREIFVSLLDVLDAVHAAGVLHRDIKPSNVLLGPQGEVLLIDFGAAREWAEDAAVTHTVMHTPGYAPPEQLAERAVRGPGTDLYGLCATIYHALAGRPPATPNDQLAGLDATPLIELRSGLDPSFVRAIEAGLEPRLADRPSGADEMREILRDDDPETMGPLTLDRIDDMRVRLAAFRFDRRACPNCDGLLAEPKPLRKSVCPVCTEGIVRKRNLDEDRCPLCRIGRLERIDNSIPLAICPSCANGRLSLHRRSLLSFDRIADCAECGAKFDIVGDAMRQDGESRTCDEWRERCGRSSVVWVCSACDGQLDEMGDGRRRQAFPPSEKPSAYYPEEWSRLAAGLPLGAGNAECDACSADYWIEDERMTLLDAPRDPHGFVSRYLGRAIGVEDARWLGVGKSSGEPGLICAECRTEFDRDGDYQRLVASPNRRLSRRLGEPRVLEDWHRIARDLPTIDQEPDLEAALEPALREGFREGIVSFDEAGGAWRGKARREGDENFAILNVSPAEITFGGALRKWRVPRDAVLRAEAEEDFLILFLSGHSEAITFEILPLELVAHLKSGKVAFEVTAEDLAARLT